jgi:simple sugar transport system substrate-binding protein
MALQNESVVDGVNLKIPGYTHIKTERQILYGSAWIDVTKENMLQYQF